MLHFLGIGAQKAGTTWLYEQLNHHPQVTFPLGKEVHFWNRPHDAAAVNLYLNSFVHIDRNPRKSFLLVDWITRCLIRPVPVAPSVAGEITPAYGMLPLETIQEIHRYAPCLRLIYLIRNPIERAWSSALMALERAEMMIDEASDQWFIDHFHSAGSRQRGDYQTCLQTWREVFSEEQLLILRFEQIITEPESLLNRCFQHLGVSQQVPEQLHQWGCQVPVFAGPGYSLRPTLKPALQMLYQKQIEQLAKYLNMDLDTWLGG
ncbi:MAG: sulfotransferase [Candidatus Competibacteraceae bacterium]|nr:sulfotransferase [Candidatus Competibacteraceae bacterium]MCP5125356.1 sulfotransferase [Gammaproteobacteria bacterium]HRX70261.1 sulfotransferase [Candidatus Competibacteraceae bacterium]